MGLLTGLLLVLGAGAAVKGNSKQGGCKKSKGSAFGTYYDPYSKRIRQVSQNGLYYDYVDKRLRYGRTHR